MADLLRSWLEQDVGVYSNNIEEDCSNGYLLGMVLAKHNLQPDFPTFNTESKPAAVQANFAKLKPALEKLGLKLDARTAQAIISKQQGVAPKMLYEVKQAIAQLERNAEAIDHAGYTTRQLAVRTSPTKQLLDSQQHKSQQLAYVAGKDSLFQDILRKRGESPNKLLESLHLQRFTEEGTRQSTEALDALFESRRQLKEKQSNFRGTLQDKMRTSRNTKASQLQHDDAVHAALLKHKSDIEREELRVEIAMQHLHKQRQQDQKAAAAADAATGIDAFEMTLKRLGGGEDDTGGTPAGDAAGDVVTGVPQGPLETLNRLQTLAPSLNQLQEDCGDYMARIKAQRTEDLHSRKERESRRRRLVAEQVAAREAAAARRQEASLLEGLVRQSAEEAALGQRLWQLRQEKAAMEANRKLREEQYAAQKDKEWQAALLREQELHRQLAAQYAEEAASQRAAWAAAQEARAVAKAAKHAAYGRDLVWGLVALAERVVGYRSAAAGAPVPKKEWRQWLAMFMAGDPALRATSSAQQQLQPEGGASNAEEPKVTSQVLNKAELQEYLRLSGDWSLEALLQAAAAAEPPPAAAPGGKGGAGGAKEAAAAAAAAAASAAAVAQVKGGSSSSSGGQLGLVVADLAALAAAAFKEQEAQEPVAPKLSKLPLRLAVVGGPVSGKTAASQHLATRFKLKLLSPEQLIQEALTAAQQAAAGGEEAAEAAKPAAPAIPVGLSAAAAAAAAAQAAAEAADQTDIAAEKARVGAEVQQHVAGGGTVPDELLVQLCVLGMRESLYYVPPEQRLEAGGSSGSKKGAGAAAGARPSSKDASKPAAAAGAKGGPGGAVPPPQGFVLDGFPATHRQAVLLEKALTCLDLESEEAFMRAASEVAPPPLSKLPVLERTLVSGLNAVVVLEGVGEDAAAARALGRRLDPLTGTIYHLDWDPPPKSNPGLVERLQPLPRDQQQAATLTKRLSSWQEAAPQLLSWLSRFMRLKRPVDAAAELQTVLASAGDVASGLLRAVAAVSAAQGAAEAAAQASESAHRAKEYAQAAQGHAEAAARELLAAKRAEIAASGLLTGGKNPDPAAAEVLKVQAAAKCADQLKVCRAAAAEAGGFAERATASAGVAADAVSRAKRALGSAELSAEAEAAAKKAAADAEAASSSAAEAASKAAAAKQLAEAYVKEAEQWMAAPEVPATATIPTPAAVAAAEGIQMGGETAGVASAAAAADVAAEAAARASGGGAVSSSGSSTDVQAPQLVGEPATVRGMAAALHRQWQQLEANYVQGLGAGFAGVRQARGLALSHMQMCGARFKTFLQRGHTMQAAVQAFVERFNAVDADLRLTKEAKGELLLRCEELRNSLWAQCDARQEAAEAERGSLSADPATVEHVSLLGQQYAQLVQVEVDRLLSTSSFLLMFSLSAHGAPLPASLPELCPVPSSIVSATIPPEFKDRLEGKGAPPPPAIVAGLAGKAPLLCITLRLASAVATAVQTRVGQLADETAGGDPKKGGKPGPAAPAPGAPASKPAGKAAPAAPEAAQSNSEAEQKAAAEARAAAATTSAWRWLQQEVVNQVNALQQRLTAVAAKATASIDELMVGQAAVNTAMGQWLQQAYIGECSAVAALEHVVKAAAAAGQPLPYDLRLEDTHLIVDETQLLVAPPSPPPTPPAPVVPPSPGLLSYQQLQGLVAQLQAAAPEGMLRVPAAVELLMGMAAAGQLPTAWRALDASHLLCSLSAFDPVDCGYLDWRELAVALIAAAYPELTKATAAELAAVSAAAAALLQQQRAGAEAAAGAAAVGGRQGQGLSREGYLQLQWWVDPKEPVDDQVAAAQELAAGRARAQELKELLWQVFVAVPPERPPPPPPGSVSPAGSRAPSTGGSIAAAADGTSQASPAATAAVAPAASPGPASPTEPAAAAEPEVEMVSLLLYACADPDQYVGIQKAVAVVSAEAGARRPRVRPEQVLRIAYPLPQHVEAAHGDAGRTLLLPREDVIAVVQRAAAAAAGTTAAAAAVPAAAGKLATPAAADLAAVDVEGITAEQLMYSEACERVVSLLMGRYQLRDVYTAARL